MRILLSSLAVLAGACLILGAVLDWSGVDYSPTFARRVVLAAGVAMVFLGFVARLWREGVLKLAFLPAVLSLNMSAVNLRDIDGGLDEYSAYPETSVGVGLYLALAGAVLALVTGILAMVPKRRRSA